MKCCYYSFSLLTSTQLPFEKQEQGCNQEDALANLTLIYCLQSIEQFSYISQVLNLFFTGLLGIYLFVK